MTFVAILALLVSFGLVMVLLPRVIFPLADIPGTFLDRTIAGAIAITALTVAAAYLLWAVGMFETIALVAVWIGAWWVLKGRHQESGRLSRAAHRFFMLWDLAEAKGKTEAAQDVRAAATTRVGTGLRRGMRRFREGLTDPGALLTAGAILAILAVAGWLRFERAIDHIELVPQDSYLALFWTKSISTGRLLEEGIYPQGAYIWTSLLDRFYFLDTYTFVRFVGPMMNVLELVVLYWAVSRFTRSRTAGILSMAVLGLFAGNPSLFVDWSRQIGSMTQELALAFAIVSLVFGALYMAERRTPHVLLAASAMFLAVTSHTITMIVLGIGYALIVLVGAVTGTWTPRTFIRTILASAAAVLAGNLYFLLGVIRGEKLVLSYALYDPRNPAGFSGSGADVPAAKIGEQLAGNALFQLAVAGAVIAVIVGIVTALRRRHGRILLVGGSVTLAYLLYYDLIAVRLGLLFRVRNAWVAGEFMAIGVGLGVGALAVAVSALMQVREPFWAPGSDSSRGPRIAVELGALVLALVVLASLWPTYSTVARVADPSGYPQATQASQDIITSEERLKYTFVGVSEQYQEGAFNGFHVESWVFAKDITFSDARDPSYEVPIPTDRIYIFTEKVVFPTPESRPFGPTEEYYRNAEKRRRMMQRIGRWSEEYRRFHSDMDVYYEDDEIKVFRISRSVDVQRADRDQAFKASSYRWQPGEYFDDDADITADRVVPNPAAREGRAAATGGTLGP